MREELLIFREVFDREKEKWLLGVRATQDEREVFFYRKLIGDNTLAFLSIDEENYLNNILDEFEEGYNHLQVIDGKAYEVLYSGAFVVRQRIFILPN